MNKNKFFFTDILFNLYFKLKPFLFKLSITLFKLIDLYRYVINSKIYIFFKKYGYLIMKILSILNLILGTTIIIAFNFNIYDYFDYFITNYEVIKDKIHIFIQSVIKSIINKLNHLLDDPSEFNNIDKSNKISDKISDVNNTKTNYIPYILLTIVIGGVIYYYYGDEIYSVIQLVLSNYVSDPKDPGILPDLSESNIQNYIDSKLDNLDNEIKDNVNNRLDQFENLLDRYFKNMEENTSPAISPTNSSSSSSSSDTIKINRY